MRTGSTAWNAWSAGVTPRVGPAGVLSPKALVATTVNVYGVPLASPATHTGELRPTPVAPPGLAVTVYDVIALPPLSRGGTNVTLAALEPAVAPTPVGGSGATGSCHPMSSNIASATKPGLWMASFCPRIGVISASSVPLKVVSSRCEKLDP